MPASSVLIGVVDKGVHSDTVRSLAGALIAIDACILLDVPAKVVAWEISVCPSVLKAAWVVCRIALAAHPLFATRIGVEGEIIVVALLHTWIVTTATIGYRGHHGRLVRLTLGQRGTSLGRGNAVIASITSRKTQIIEVLARPETC